MVDTLFYYTGSFHGPDGQTYYRVEFSENGEDYRLQPEMLQEHSMTFQWRTASLNTPLEPTRFIRITAVSVPLELGELCILASDDGGQYLVTEKLDVTVSSQNALALFDEQALIPAERSTVNGMYFDEIYHARAAYEMNNNLTIYEITHPPLGKEIIALGTKLFGMTPFGWRFMGTLFGVLMLPLMYLLLKQLFGSSLISVCGTVILATDFMHLTQTRIATIDTYNVFFVLLAFVFIHRWMTLPDDTPFLKTLFPLFMCGLAFGLGAAAKWSSVYAGLGLAALYIIKMWNSGRRRGAKFIVLTLFFSVVFFIVIPAAVYITSYLPYLRIKGLEPNLQNLFKEMWDNQVYMFDYHTDLKDTHPYSARWYHWLADIKPICYFYQLDSSKTMVSTIMALNNPLLAWGGLLSLCLCAWDVVERRCARAMFILCGYLSVFLPWVLISRLTFPYHYFPASVFLVVAISYVFWRIRKELDERKAGKLIGAFTLVSAGLFVMFYPVITGVPVSYWYTKYILQWLPSWPL